MSEAYLHHELTGRIIGAAIEVHRALSSGYLEQVYEKALCLELSAQGLAFARQVPYTVQYRGQPVGEYRADLIVEGKVLVEVKAVPVMTDAHRAQVLNYLSVTGLRIGLILNFGTGKLGKERLIR